MTPESERAICRTSGGDPTMEKTTSEERARAAGEGARWAPRASREEALDGLRA